MTTGTLSITTTPIAADIYVNYEKIGNGSWTGELYTGEYVVYGGTYSNYQAPAQQTVKVLKDKITTVVLTCTQNGGDTGTLKVNTYTDSNQDIDAPISINTGDWIQTGSDGYYEVEMEIGNGICDFGDVAGYYTPSGQTFTITANSVDRSRWRIYYRATTEEPQHYHKQSQRHTLIVPSRV